MTTDPGGAGTAGAEEQRGVLSGYAGSPGQAADAARQASDLVLLHGAVTRVLRESGLPYYERDGEVTVVVSADERVTARFAGPGGNGVEVRYGAGGQAEFAGPLPGPRALAGLIRGLVDEALARSAPVPGEDRVSAAAVPADHRLRDDDLRYLREVSAVLESGGIRPHGEWEDEGCAGLRAAMITVTAPAGPGTPETVWKIAWWEDRGFAVGTGKAGKDPLYLDSGDVTPPPGQAAAAIAARITGGRSGWVPLSGLFPVRES